MASGTEGSAGVVPINADLTGEFDFGSSASAAAQGGRISTGAIFNTSSTGSLGLVKMLTLAGLALIAFRLFRRR